MRVILSIIGAIIGLGLANGSHMLLGLLLGAFAGFTLVELGSLQTQLRELESEVAALRKLVAQRLKRDVEGQEGAGAQEPVSGWSAAANATSSSPAPSTSLQAGVGSVASVGTARPPVTPVPQAASSSTSHAATGPAAPPAAAQASASATESASRRSAQGSTQQTTAQSRQSAARGPQPAARASRDDIVDTITRLVREYFTGGNTLVRVGIIILFFGVAFLLRYVAEHSHVPIEFRLSGVALGGIVLLVLGWRLRERRPGYGLALQGGAVGILYLTVFASLRIYSLLPAGAAFAVLVLLAAFSAALAILQSSQSFALLAVTGGFLAPILASNGQGDHVTLFSYYAVLNAGILLVAWFRAWRPLNLAGFLFTFVIGTAWGVLKYQAQLFASTEPFLVLFFLFYVAIAILFATRQPPELRGYVDGGLVFGTPIAAFGLQSAMLHQRPFVLAYSALAMSALYLTLATVLHRSRQASQRLLIEAFMALGVLFLTLAVPLALDGRWSAATWAVEGAALVWIGCRQYRKLPRAFGAVLQIAGGVIFCADIDAPHGNIPILNSAYLGGVMVSAASVFSAAMLERTRKELAEYERVIAPVLFFWGVLWWLFSGLTEIQRRVPDRYEASVGLLLMGLTAVISSELERRARLSIARIPSVGLLPAMAIYAIIAAVEVSHPFENGGWLAWPLTFAAFYLICRRHEGEPGRPLASSLHVGSAWLLIALLSWELAWTIGQGVVGGGSWSVIAWALVPAMALFVMPRLVRRLAWPAGLHEQAYAGIAGAGLALYLGAWSLVTNVTMPGDPHPLPFVPLLNPLDLAEFFILLVLVRFWLYLRSRSYSMYENVRGAGVFATLTALAFVWLNEALLRAIHHLAGIPFLIGSMLSSTLVQTSLSIFWTLLALTTMLVASRTAARVVWLTGAGLLGVVIVKLFLVDLSRVGTIERIISFVGVGLLTLVIGYFSPLPPAATSGELQQPSRADT